MSDDARTSALNFDDRVVIPGRVTGYDSEGAYQVEYESGTLSWHYRTDLRPDTGAPAMSDDARTDDAGKLVEGLTTVLNRAVSEVTRLRAELSASREREQRLTEAGSEVVGALMTELAYEVSESDRSRMAVDAWREAVRGGTATEPPVQVEGAWLSKVVPPAPAPAPADERPRRLQVCVEEWPECRTGDYDPRCCRFPKSCSCDCYDPDRVADDALEPARTPGSEASS